MIGLPVPFRAREMCVMNWDAHWEETKERFRRYWNRDGLIVVPGLWALPYEMEPPRDATPKPVEPDDPRAYWLDPGFRASKARWELARTAFLPDGLPFEARA
jgi:hypothetical protein